MPKNRVAIYSGVSEIGIREVDLTAPPPEFVILDTRCSGVCGSDLHSYFGHWEQSREFAPGHEAAGVIHELGKDVTGFRIGDRVTFECFSHCGNCVYCRQGLYNHCAEIGWVSRKGHGGFAKYSCVHYSSLFRMPQGMSFEQGALVEPLAVAYRAVARSAACGRDRLAIIGGGTIGLLCLAVAKATGVKEAWITAKYDHQASLAEELGADHVVRGGQTDLRHHVNKSTAGLGVDAVIECVGGGACFDDALAIVRRRGTVVLMAGYHGADSVHLGQVVSSEAAVTGSNCYSHTGLETDFQASIDLIQSGKVDPTKLVTHRFGLEEISKAFKIAAGKSSGSIKVHICQ